jgi:protein-tyrosine phosphatase
MTRSITYSLCAFTVFGLLGSGGGGESAGVVATEPSTGSAVASAPTPEHLATLQGQPNFRDLGGYETADGRRVVSGQIYRSGELSHLTDEDVTALADLEIRTVVNFLLPEEIEKNGPDRLPGGVREDLQPIAGERAAKQTMVVTAAIKSGEFEKVPPEINPEFHRLLTEEGRGEYAALLREAAKAESRPLVYHCSHGVHRTGTATAVLLSALGVPWETIREEYLLTNEYRREEVEATLIKIRQMTAENRGIAPDDVDMANIEAFYVLDGSYIDGTLEQAIADYGSMEAYIRNGLGVSDDEIENLREQLLE